MTTESNEDDANASGYQNASELFRSNLFRHECKELLSESHLHLWSKDASNDLHHQTMMQIQSTKSLKYSSHVQNYISEVTRMLYNIFEPTKSSHEKFLPIPSSTENKLFPIPLKSDKYQKLGNKWNIPLPVSGENQTANSGNSNCTIKINTVGSYVTQCMTTKEANGYVLPMIDLAIVVGPKNTNIDKFEKQNSDKDVNEFWMSKDYLNYRYLDKRNLLVHYIGNVLRHKKNRKTIGSVTYSQIASCPSKLTIILTPPLPTSTSTSTSKKKQKTNKYPFRVRLLIGIPPNLFSPTRFFPTRNNLPAFSAHKSINSSSPTYNSSIIASDGMFDILSNIYTSVESLTNKSLSTSSSSLSEAVVLLKVWLAQRGMRNGHDTLNSTGLYLLMIYLLKSKKISLRMSSWEMVIIWFKFVSETNWIGEGGSSKFGKFKNGVVVNDMDDDGDSTIRHTKSINDSLLYYTKFSSSKSDRKQQILIITDDNYADNDSYNNSKQANLYKEMRSSELKSDSLPPTLLEAFQESTDGPILLDSSLTCNFLSHCSTSSMRELAKEAARTLYMINHCEENRYGVFGDIFCKPCRFWRKFDVYVKIPMDRIDYDKIWKSDNITDTIYDGIDAWKNKKNDLGERECIVRGMIDLLTVALGDRIRGIRPLTCGNGEGMEYHSNQQRDTKDASSNDADQIPSITKSEKNSANQICKHAITTCLPNYIVLGIQINSENASRIVDRGPPAQDAKPSMLFTSLWGKQLAQLRRFKDGAIVHAVVWKDVILSGNNLEYLNSDASGGIVEKIVQHVLQLHFLKKEANVKFELRNMLSLIEGLSPSQSVDYNQRFQNSNTLHKNVMKSFESLSAILKHDKSPLGLPLNIDAVEPISPCLRYSSLFPPVPHPLLGGNKAGSNESKVSSVTVGEPILIQIRFEGNSKWPTQMAAMGAAKCAMMIKLAEGIDGGTLAGFNGPATVYPDHLDFGYQGYSWRAIVRADQELRMLNSLWKPSIEAISLHQTLTKRHIVSSLHHSLIHAIHTRYPSSGPAVRLAQRWISSHMLSKCISTEAIELIVAKGYINPYPLETPGTAIAGFMRFLNTLSKFDWARQPFIVDPQGHLRSTDISQIRSKFESTRGSEYNQGPPMFIISPFDRIKNLSSSSTTPHTKDNSCDDDWIPTSTEYFPEKVVLLRMISLARLSYHNLMLSNMTENGKDNWSSVFQESASSIKSFSVLLRVSPDLVIDKTSCSTAGQFGILKTKEGKFESSFTRSLKKRFYGPKMLKMRVYKNLTNATRENVVHGWQPVEELVTNLRSKFGSTAVFFFNELSPHIIAILWRPSAFQPQPFSVATAEYKRPVGKESCEDCLMITNSDDVLREIEYMGNDIIVDVKILDDKSMAIPLRNECGGIKRKASDIDKNNESSESDEDD